MAPKNELPIVEVIQVDESFELKDNVIEFYASLEEFTVIGPRELKEIQTGIQLKIPSGYYMLVTMDIPLFKETNLILAGGVFIINSGDEDEVVITLANLTRKSITINHGDCIAIGTLIKSQEFSMKNVDSFKLRGDI